MSGERSEEHAVVIPAEARTHQGQDAGIISRLIAALLDLATVICGLVAAYLSWSATLFLLDTRTFRFPQPSAALLFGAYFVVATCFLAAPWRVNGRSYGQHVMGLRVTTRHGDLLSLPRALLRAVLCVYFPIGLLWVVVSRRHAAVHDLLLSTVVRYDWTTWR
ncbi:RDD family protein [Nocardioides sp. W7]|uniref:RDD family protein n=1 Tax=Nocardioides sp. W7 TaxID=2931390 RepID=UPI001FD049DF|nr:RDD family protein [Nocardioides sp. W7]